MSDLTFDPDAARCPACGRIAAHMEWHPTSRPAGTATYVCPGCGAISKAILTSVAVPAGKLVALSAAERAGLKALHNADVIRAVQSAVVERMIG